MKELILAIDQGTTSSRALVFNRAGQQLGLGQQEFRQYYPKNGWVEHDGQEIWETTLSSCLEAINDAGISVSELACIGISNQRETTLLWDRETGKPIHRAIVWQDRRTSAYCEQLKKQGLEQTIQKKTGLIIDPYFSATKLKWLLDNVDGARQRAEQGRLAFGTVDSFLLWKFTNGERHATDATNASRTMLFNIHEQCWDEELLTLLEIPVSVLPEILDSAAEFGRTEPSLLDGSLPITGILGDQQAASFGQCCFSAGMAKSTYGTGCFLLLNTGGEVVESSNRLLSTVAYRLKGQPRFAVEGSIFMAGATIQWVRDELGLIRHAADSESLARNTPDDSSVYLVPAFTGLGAPYWDAAARAAIFGMTRDTGAREIVTAALMAVCYQTRDLVEAIIADGGQLEELRVDGGMARNEFLLQRIADILDREVQRPVVTETTALGAAYIAGLQAGLYESLEQIESNWKLDRTWTASENEEWRRARYTGWQDAVRRTLGNFANN